MSAAGADMVFVGGAVFSAGLTGSRPRGVAIKDGRILQIGADDDLRAFITPNTEIVDLAGGLLLPGFQDAHVHPVMAGVEMLRCELHGASSAGDAGAVSFDFPGCAGVAGHSDSSSPFNKALYARWKDPSCIRS